MGICQCPEFKETHKPCKHIYRIALNKGLIQAATEGKS
ncbi:SWIM zinc finger family protein [Enterocloster bolteae]